MIILASIDALWIQWLCIVFPGLERRIGGVILIYLPVATINFLAHAILLVFRCFAFIVVFQSPRIRY